VLAHALRCWCTPCAGYLLSWTFFSIVAAALQRVLSEMLVLTPMMEVQNRTWAGAAGDCRRISAHAAQEFLPQHCVRRVHLQHWRADPRVGYGGSARLYCLGAVGADAPVLSAA
jgi:predicted metal-binding membrane protein